MPGQFASRGDGALTAPAQAIEVLARFVKREALVMAYGGAFLIVGAVVVAMMLAAWWCRPVKEVSPAH